MFLNGSLENFSVADILQLLSFSKQTGALHVRGEVSGILYLDDGEAYFATKEGGWPLEETVAAAGIPRDDWNAALESAGERHEAGQALAERGVAADLIGYVVHRIVSDTAFELMRMPREEGSFDFRVEEKHPLGPVHKLRIDDLVSEVRERLAQWEAISEFISSPTDLVTAAEELSGDSVELTVTREQWALLVAAIRRGGSSVSDLARDTGHSDGEVASALHPLIGSGLLEVRERGNGMPVETTFAPTAEPLPASEPPSIAEAAAPEAPVEDIAGELSDALFPPEARETTVPEPTQEASWWDEGEEQSPAPAEAGEEPPPAPAEPEVEEESGWQPPQTWGEATPAGEQPQDEGELQVLEPPSSPGPEEWTLEPGGDEPGTGSRSQLWFEGDEESEVAEPAAWNEAEAADPFGTSSEVIEPAPDEQSEATPEVDSGPLFEGPEDEQPDAGPEAVRPEEGLWDLGDGSGGLEAEPAEEQRAIPPPPPEVETTGIRTLALQELRDLAGTAPVQPARGIRPSAPAKDAEAAEEKAPAQPKIRALRRIIAAVRGL